MTDIATRSTENRSVKNKAQKRVFAALEEIREAFPFPILGINADDTVNGPDSLDTDMGQTTELNRHHA